jgi:steroid delta-isomerase-like uncharacterized protein
MVHDANRALIARYVELWNTGTLAIADEVLAADFVDHTHPEAEPGPEAVKRMVRDFRAAFPDAAATIEQMVAENESVAFRFVLRGTHTGTAPFAGIPPRGTRIALVGMDFVPIADGKMVELWSCQDTLGLLQQLGAIPGQRQEPKA